MAGDARGFGQTLDLLAQAREGDGEALNDLLTRYAPRILEVVRIRLGRPLREAVESVDILQETLLDAFRGFDRFELREDAHFVGWLSRIAERRILRRAEYHGALKRDSGRAQPLERRPASGSTEFGFEPSSGETSPLSRIARDERRDAVADCVAELPEHYRAVIAARDYVGADWETVAEETGHSTSNAARMTHHRARIALGKLLRERGMAPDAD